MSQSVRSEIGASILETMIAVGIMGAVVASATAYLGAQIKQHRVESAKSVVRNIAERVRQDLSNVDHIRTSKDLGQSPGNIELRNCVNPDANTNICTVTNPSNQVTFDLWRLSNGGSIAAGGDSNPILYNLSGSRCAVPGVDGCSIQALSYFWATCPLDAGGTPQVACPMASTINFRYLVRVNPAEATGFYENLKETTYPPKALFDNNYMAFSSKLLAKDIGTMGAQSCGPGRVQLGVKTNGKPECRCLGQNTSSDPSAGLCPKVECPTGQVFIGFEADGSTKCGILGCQNGPCDCQRINTNLETGAVNTCPAGTFVNKASLGGNCNVPGGKKGDAFVIQCSDAWMECCNMKF